jgi:trimethylamine--corrinoid protein Co-methyltransferase
MDRYRTAFYEPLVADLQNFGAWEDAGAKTSADRATEIWKQTLRDFVKPPTGEAVSDRLAEYIEARIAAGGAHPME